MMDSELNPGPVIILRNTPLAVIGSRGFQFLNLHRYCIIEENDGSQRFFVVMNRFSISIEIEEIEEKRALN